MTLASSDDKALGKTYHWLGVSWIVALIYFSLLPLEFRPLPWADVIRPFLQPLVTAEQDHSITDWITNIGVFLPLGYFLAASASQSRSANGQLRFAPAMRVWIACVALSAGIEFSQSFFPPRDASTADMLANAIGSACGIAARWMVGAPIDRLISDLLRAATLPPRRPTGKTGAIITASICGVWLAFWAGLLPLHWSNLAQASERWQALQWWPFVRHQEAAIMLAISSTAIAAAAYAPVGAALWWHGAFAGKPWRTRISRTAGVAAAAAVALEGAKLLLTTRTPDSGNVVIAALSAGLTYWLSPLVWYRSKIPSPEKRPTAEYENVAQDDGQSAAAVERPRSGALLARLCAVLCAVAALVLVVHYPISPALLATGLGIYAIVLLRYPLAWLVVVPALLPVLDLAPWTGWHTVDAFDAVILTSLAIGLWRRTPDSDGTRHAGWGFWLLFVAFCVSFLAASVHGMLPLQPIDTNALGNPYDSYAGLGLAKALVLACGIAFLLRRQAAFTRTVWPALGAGVMLGLIGASISVLIERIAYAGLSNFSDQYRAVGMFSTMHTGGAALDAFLLFAMPFAGVWALGRRPHWQRGLALVTLAAGSYAVMMTFSRTTVAGLALEAIFITVFAAWTTRGSGRRITGMATTLIAAVAIMGTIVAPVLLGTFMQSRLAGTDADLQTRFAHWRDSYAMMTDSWQIALFGMGPGSFARTYELLGPPQLRPAAHRIESEHDNRFLRIYPGVTAYVEQIVPVAPRQTYTVSLSARGHGADNAVNLLLCDRTLLQGYGCQSVSFRWHGDDNVWKHLEGTLHSGTVGANRLRTSKLSLENAGRQSAVDLDDIKLVDMAGVDRLVNGNFEAGVDRWDYSSPFNHLPWHIKNIWMEVLFNQGWVGLLLFTAVIAGTGTRLLRLAHLGDATALAMLASLLGLLAVGAFDSILDAPRLVMVFIVLIAAAGLLGRPATQRVRHTAQPAPSGNGPAYAVQPERPKSASSDKRTTLPQDVPKPVPATWSGRLLPLAFHVLALAIGIAVLTRLPFVPYHLHSLVNPFHPVLATLLLALSIYWIFGLPALAGRWLMRSGLQGMAFPIALVIHALAGWWLLRYAVLPDSIHNIVGVPVLDWPWDFEVMVRMVTLLSAVTLPLTAGAVLARMATRHHAGLAPVWLLLSFGIATPLQYAAIVTWAATDNLTELMAGNASVASFVTLQLYVLLIGTSASLAGALRNNRTWRRMAVLLASLTLSLPIGYWLLKAGTEPMLIKYQSVFSAMQFMFSADRSHYAQGPALLLRYAVFHVGAVMLIAWIQLPFNVAVWRRHSRKPGTSRHES